MWKLGFLLIIAALGYTCGQNVTINCSFGDYGMGMHYMCSLSQITVLDRSENVIFSGTHTGNRTHADVDLVEIYSSNSPFIINQLFTTFPNLRYLNIYDSNLASIVIPPEAQLVQLVIQGNNVSKIENHSFRNQTQLRYIYITNSGVTDIDDDAFDGLDGVEYFFLMNNRIHSLTPRTLAPLKNVLWITIHINSLSEIGEHTFSQNTKLERLFLGDNQIDQIHPRAFSNLGQSLTYIDLNGNRCVSEAFSLESEQDWTRMNSSLELCFRNTPVRRNITIEFSGSMTIYDELGNIIARL